MIIYPAPPYQSTQELSDFFQLFDPWCSGYHLDFMDGSFVPSTFSSVSLINKANHLTPHHLWIHLMTSKVEQCIQTLSLKPKSIISFHYETESEKTLQDCARFVHEKGLIPSITINPQTEVTTIVPLLPFFQHVLVMTVMPGKSGQMLIPETLTKITALHAYQQKQKLSFFIAADGGINETNYKYIKQAGAHECAMTMGLFGTPDPLATFKQLTAHLNNT